LFEPVEQVYSETFLRDRALWPRRRDIGAPRRSRPGRRTFCRTPTPWARGCAGTLPTHLLLPRIRLGAAQTRPSAPAVAACWSLPVRPTIYHPCSSSSVTSSLHPHPLDPPVHVHWSADLSAHRHCGRRGRPPPPSPPTVAGATSCRTDPTKRPRVSSNPTLATHSPESGRPHRRPALLRRRGTD
jgi:hypothetical protein